MNREKFKLEVFVLKDKLYRFAYSFFNSIEESEDVTQEVLMKLWDMRRKLNQYQSVEAFAMTMTRNKCLDKLRKDRLKLDREKEISEWNRVEEQNHDEKEIRKLIENTIQKLNEPQRTIIHLRDIEEYSFEEIEKVVNMKVETIRVNLSRARKAVRLELNKILSYGVEQV